METAPFRDGHDGLAMLPCIHHARGLNALCTLPSSLRRTQLRPCAPSRNPLLLPRQPMQPIQSISYRSLVRRILVGQRGWPAFVHLFVGNWMAWLQLPFACLSADRAGRDSCDFARPSDELLSHHASIPQTLCSHRLRPTLSLTHRVDVIRALVHPPRCRWVVDGS